MVFLLLLLAMLATTSSLFMDDYTLTLHCDGTLLKKTTYCYLPGISLNEMKYYKLDLLRDDSGRCRQHTYRLEEHDNKAAVRVYRVCNGIFGIKNGYTAYRCQFPWMAYVRLYWKAGYRVNCGGSMVSDRWILTAAHCIVRQHGDGKIPPLSAVYARTGSLHKSEHYIKREVDKIVIHSGYNVDTLLNDVALLRLKKAVKWDGCHAPICLNSNITIEQSRDLNCMISGWGRSGIKPPKATYKLLWAYDHILTREQCDKIYTIYSNNYTLCGRATKAGNRGFCTGDSGGPLVCKSKQDGRFYQHGIVSLYLGYRNCQMEGLYSSVQAYYSWIRQYVN